MWISLAGGGKAGKKYAVNTSSFQVSRFPVIDSVREFKVFTHELQLRFVIPLSPTMMKGAQKNGWA